ncbi:hypothetical protein LZC95_52985 [Pendulispora brunnea]|uniref:ABC transporter ATP-binding protein n=1 Tax=Pendulispora brunnea TaxID=2905690 RepID=A0ABZ2K8Y9_9BACT
MPGNQPPLLEAKNLRLDEDGAPQVDGLSLATQGNHVVILGAPRALFEAAAGMRSPARGELSLYGTPCADALASRHVAGAPLDPALPPKWTVRRYVEWSARLVGHSRSDARAHASEALQALELTALANAPLGPAPIAARRATVLAAALATKAHVLAFEDPTLGLPEAGYRALSHILARALHSRPWLLFAARAPLDTPLCLEADDAVVLLGSRVVAQGIPSELAARERTYAVRVAGDVPTFASLVMARGARVEASGSELTLELGDSLGTRDLLELANQSRSVIVELRPLARAFA